MRLIAFGLLALSACSIRIENVWNPKDGFEDVIFVAAYDADTITVTLRDVHPFFGKNAKVRIQGIDTAEIKGHDECERQAAIKARDMVVAKLKTSKHINLTNLGREKFGRILADVIADGDDIGLMLIQANLANVYHGEKKPVTDWCQKMLVKQ